MFKLRVIKISAFKLSAENTLIMGHPSYITICGPNLELYLGMAANDLVLSYREG